MATPERLQQARQGLMQFRQQATQAPVSKITPDTTQIPTSSPTTPPMQPSSLEQARKGLAEFRKASTQPVVPTVPTFQRIKPTFERKVELPKEENPFTGLAIGAEKELLQTFRGMSSLGERTLGRLVAPQITAKKGEPTSAEQLIPEKLIKATTPAQKLGKLAAGIAEFAIPGDRKSVV